MGRILVTGASGFVGAAVTRRLLAEGHAVAALSRGAPGPRLAGLVGDLIHLRGDLAVPGDWTAALRAFGPRALVHAAWEGVHGPARRGPEQARNVEQARALMAALASLGVEHVVGFGSQAEYGPLAGAVDEDALLRPDTDYGRAKVQACRILGAAAAAQGAAFAWLRLFTAYGPGHGTDWVLDSVVLQLLRGATPALSAGEQRWDFLYIDDVAEAVAAVLRTRAKGLFNLGSGQAPRLRDTVEALRDLVDPALPLRFGALPYTGPMHLQADRRRLTAATGWEPQVPLDLGLRRLVESLRTRGGGGPVC